MHGSDCTTLCGLYLKKVAGGVVLFSVVLGLEPRASPRPVKHSSTELLPQQRSPCQMGSGSLILQLQATGSFWWLPDHVPLPHSLLVAEPKASGSTNARPPATHCQPGLVAWFVFPGHKHILWRNKMHNNKEGEGSICTGPHFIQRGRDLASLARI